MSANAAAMETHRPRSVPTPPSRTFVFQKAFIKEGVAGFLLSLGKLQVSVSVNERGGFMGHEVIGLMEAGLLLTAVWMNMFSL